MGTDKTILIIDDDLDFQYMVGTMLRTNGYEVKSLLEGKINSALTLAKQADLILLDIELPGSSGVDLGTELKSFAETVHVPIIVITGHDHGDLMFQQSRANAFIPKPFSLSALLRKIKELLPSVDYVSIADGT